MHDRAKSNLVKRLEPFQHVIWDWNGTLVDDVELAIKAVGLLLTEHGLPSIETGRYREVFGFPIIDYYGRLGFDFNLHCLNDLSTKFHENYNAGISNSRLFADVKTVLQALGKTRKQSILSAAAQWHLDVWVKSFGIYEFFDHVFGIGDQNATSKLERGKELLALSGIPAASTILVGDTDHDLEVGRELGVEVLLVADGHQSYERLASLHDNVVPSRFV